MARVLRAEALTAKEYAPYGDVLSADRDDVEVSAANQGSARRCDWIGELVNLRPGARPNLAVFRCAPREPWPFPVKLLEKHPDSTQVFVPMNATRYLVVVALGGEAPDMATLRVFEATGTQGVTYRPGVWHHPMIAVGELTDFACLVWEDRGPRDCVVYGLPEGEWALEGKGREVRRACEVQASVNRDHIRS